MEVIEAGVGDDGTDNETLGKGVCGDTALERVIVCRSELNAFGLAGCPIAGDGGLDDVVDGGEEVAEEAARARRGTVAPEPGRGVFLLGAKDRKNDQSDSNCTESNSLDRGEWSNRAGSIKPSIRFSTTLIMNTVQPRIICLIPVEEDGILTVDGIDQLLQQRKNVQCTAHSTQVLVTFEQVQEQSRIIQPERQMRQVFWAIWPGLLQILSNIRIDT